VTNYLILKKIIGKEFVAKASNV